MRHLYVSHLTSSDPQSGSLRDRINYPVDNNRAVWIQVAKGSVLLNDKLLD
ncbi:hypothetical protein [Hyella patelloides]|uniref:pirin family protein n=1 Tax=Hyella patelloides TaxID=1982969 RepID=UPI003CCC83FB